LIFSPLHLRVVLCLSVCSVGWAQQVRDGRPDPAALSKAVIERHLQSMHPVIPSDPSKPTPGKYLLGRKSARSNQLRSRIRATTAARPQPQVLSKSSASAVSPGIQFRNALPAGAIANSVVTGDFNKDGHMDFVVANGGTDDLWIYFGNGDGTFQLPIIIPLTKGLTPVYLATADLRGIGVLDLIVAEFDTSTVGVLLGNGDGTFGFEQEYLLPQPPGALVVDDFNHDGKLDIASVLVTELQHPEPVPYIATLLGDGTGKFGAPVTTPNYGFFSSATSIASGDVNGDGLPEVLITGPGLENSQIFLNNGDGTFTAGQTVQENSGFSILMDGKLADINEDGCADAEIADGNNFVWLFTGDCSGNFTFLGKVPMGDGNSALRLADLNGDGHLDLVTSAIPTPIPVVGEAYAGNTLSVAFGDGHGNFTSGRDYVGTGMSYALAIADFNGDGKPDVVTPSPDTDTATVYINDGSGGFGFPQGEWIGVAGSGLINAPISAASFVDLNGDGKPDMVILDDGGVNEYYIAAMLNDGTGKFSAPILSDTGVALTSNWMGDYRLGDFRKTGHPDFVAIGVSLEFSQGVQYIVFAPGNGDGTFGKPTYTSVTGADGIMAVGDFNGDGKLDFVAVNADSTVTGKYANVFLGNGDGTFRSGGSVSFSDSGNAITRAYAGDFNRDGKLDVLVVTTSNGYWANTDVWEFLGNGDGTLQAGVELFTGFQPMTMADVNGDGWPDIVRYDLKWPGSTETLGPAKFTTYLDQPNGTFLQSGSYTPYAGVPLQVAHYFQFGDPSSDSKVGDLNGDGKLDEIAWQNIALADEQLYGQVLMGNGDGTFTPTYDVLSFNKYSGLPPDNAVILDGSKVSDLVEIDASTSAMHVYKGGPAPAVQLALEEAQVIGTSGCGWVFLNVPSASDTMVTLASSVKGITPPPSVTVPAGSLNQKFCYMLDPTYDWRSVFDIRATLGTDTAVAYASQSYVVGFTETLSPNADQVVYPTESTTMVTVSVTAEAGYSSTVQLNCANLVAGESCTFGSPTLNVSPNAVATTTVVVNTGANSQGGGPVEVEASDGNVAKWPSFNVYIQPLLVSGGGNPQATSPGTGQTGIYINGLPPYSPSCSGLPAGVTCSFSGNQLPYPSGTDLALSLNVPSGLAAGDYPFTVTVASGSVATPLALDLVISDFSLVLPSNQADWVLPGGTANVGLEVQPINGMDAVVAVTCSLNVGGTCTGGSAVVSGPNSGSVTLVVSPPANAATGAYTLTVNGTVAPLTHTVKFPFYIADYSGSLSTSSVTIARGASGSLNATVSATTGFGGTVSFSCGGTAELTCSFSPSTVQPTGTSPQTTTVTVTAGNSASVLPLKDSSTSRFLLLALIFPFGLVLRIASKGQTRSVRAVAGLFLLALIPTMLSCSGGGSGGGGGGSNTYTITVNATAAGTDTTRTLGTINVTVTH
jgi:hypothetical protein